VAEDLASVYRDRPVCVTGGAGFIGSHLCHALVELGAEVSVIDDLSWGTLDNLEAIRDRIRFVEGSILDPAALVDAASRATLIFHEAALTSVPGSVEKPGLYHEVNTTGTLRVLETARLVTSDHVRVVYASSSSAYGDRDQTPLLETLTPQPLSPYAASKCAGELLLRAYAACYGVSSISLRYFNIFGSRQRPDSPYAAVIPKFAEAMLLQRPPLIYGDGTQTRDFTHVNNAVRANLLAGASTRELHGEIVNIACGTSADLLRLLEMMAAIIGVEPEADFAPTRVGEVKHSLADIGAAKSLLGYEPVIALEEGLADAVGYYRGLFAPDAAGG
jgi:nucleoside-diphosphate-sugar epimerase